MLSKKLLPMESASIILSELESVFPDQRFHVELSNSGVSIVSISWIDGPIIGFVRSFIQKWESGLDHRPACAIVHDTIIYSNIEVIRYDRIMSKEIQEAIESQIQKIAPESISHEHITYRGKYVSVYEVIQDMFDSMNLYAGKVRFNQAFRDIGGHKRKPPQVSENDRKLLDKMIESFNRMEYSRAYLISLNMEQNLGFESEGELVEYLNQIRNMGTVNL